jgi:hypothetical protein
MLGLQYPIGNQHYCIASTTTVSDLPALEMGCCTYTVTRRNAACLALISALKSGSTNKLPKAAFRAYAFLIRSRKMARIIHPPFQIRAISPRLRPQPYFYIHYQHYIRNEGGGGKKKKSEASKEDTTEAARMIFKP